MENSPRVAKQTITYNLDGTIGTYEPFAAATRLVTEQTTFNNTGARNSHAVLLDKDQPERGLITKEDSVSE